MWCVPVAQNSVFRLEELVAGNVPGVGTYNFEYVRGDEKWVLQVKYDLHGFAIVLRAPESVKTFTYRPYVRTNNKDIQYGTPGSSINKGGTSVVGAEVTVEPAVLSTSSWNFTCSEQMENWDVVLCVGDAKFYAHKTILSFASPTFRALFEGDFREKNQKEIPVNVEGTNAEHFEAFLQCLYPCGREPKAKFLVPLVTLADFYNVKPLLEKSIDMLKVTPNVSNIVKLRVAIKVNSASFE
ncbi:transport and golgi organization-like protein, partial [Aphelenchoides avenae]